MADFNLSFQHVLKYEVGYVNDPDDPGGETKYGITKRTYPHLNIKDLTVEKAAKIYKEDWWDKHPELHGLDQASADAMFSCLINVGHSRYTQILEASRRQETLEIRFPSSSESVLIPIPLSSSSAFRLEWIRFYYRLADQKPVMRKYLRGWIRRALGE